MFTIIIIVVVVIIIINIAIIYIYIDPYIISQTELPSVIALTLLGYR